MHTTVQHNIKEQGSKIKMAKGQAKRQVIQADNRKEVLNLTNIFILYLLYTSYLPKCNCIRGIIVLDEIVITCAMRKNTRDFFSL